VNNFVGAERTRRRRNASK